MVNVNKGCFVVKDFIEGPNLLSYGSLCGKFEYSYSPVCDIWHFRPTDCNLDYSARQVRERKTEKCEDEPVRQSTCCWVILNSDEDFLIRKNGAFYE